MSLSPMKIRVLGSAAGGGFPQWNCNCANCAGLRAGTLRATARTQSSIAVCSDDPLRWVLVNASPDIRAQLLACPDLQPARALRDTAIVAVVLVDGQIDHTTGLVLLREASTAWPVWCTEAAQADLSQGFPVLELLRHYCGAEPRRIELDRPFEIPGLTRVTWRALPVLSKPAPYSPHREAPVPGDNVALVIEDAVSGRSLVYAPGLAAIDEPLWQALRAASSVMVDGTFWSDDEMIRRGVSHKRARDIGHLPQSGPDGMLGWLERLPAATRKILIHINNTNPILDERSPERAELERRGVEVAHDGLEIRL